MKSKFILSLLLFISVAATGVKNADAATANIKAGLVDTGGANLNVRKEASTSSTILAKLSNKSYVTVTGTNGNFYRVEYKQDYYGYVYKNYVNIVSSNTKRVSTGGGNLNVRYGPSTSYYKFETIKNNDYVVVLKTTNGWSNVLFEGNKVGYVSSLFLSSNSYTYPYIALSVPSFKQFDSRWAYSYVGQTNQTFKSIGCLTTAMAMSESYRKGYTITPPALANSLSYTSSGSMYWPSNYTVSTTSNYLSSIYQRLKEGKPVLVGAKTSSGGQHWVLVYGYKGSNSLTRSNFLIHDPGSSSRDTLDEFFNAYPIYYKIAYHK